MFVKRAPALLAAAGLCAILTGCVTSRSSELLPVDSNPGMVLPMSLSVGGTIYPTNAFMTAASTGRIQSFQIFDETSNGYVTAGAAAADGYRYSAVWGVRPGLGATWRASNVNLRSSYYFLMDTDMSTSGWGGIGHSLTWWKTYHPDWLLYKCSTTTNAPTTQLAYDSGLPNVPLDIHNPAVVQYQIAQVANYAIRNRYTALAADEVTYWLPATGGTGYYGCGIYSKGVFVRRYSSASDIKWISDVVTWVKSARTILNTNTTFAPYHLKFIVSHPGGNISSYETTLASNVDADLDETGFTIYGKYLTSSPVWVTREANWMKFMQAHGAAVLINQDWGSLTVGPAQKDYSAATYLLGNENAASIFVSPHTGYGVETYYHPEYAAANLGTPCGEYYGGYSGALAIYYRKFANAFVVVNAGGYGTQRATLPSGHTYVDLEGRAVSNPLSVAANDGYVLKTTNGCK